MGSSDEGVSGHGVLKGSRAEGGQCPRLMTMSHLKSCLAVGVIEISELRSII